MSDNGNVSLTIDGERVTVPTGTTIFDAARLQGIEIPTLCHLQHQRPVAVCRVCVVEVEKQRVFPASCIRQVEPDMVVSTQSDRVVECRNTIYELLMADHPSPCDRQQATGDCELEKLAGQAGIEAPRFAPRPSARGRDASSAAIAVDHEACILCDRCIRGCDEVRDNQVLGRMGKGYKSGIAFDHNLPMGDSTCISCGECMVSCPTGALTNVRIPSSELPQGEALDLEELLQQEFFRGVSGNFLSLNQGAIARRRYRKGEILCREGDFGSTAFYILEGKAEIFIDSHIGHVKSTGGASGLFSRLKSSLVGRTEDRREEESTQRFIPIDATVDLSYENAVAEVGPGDLVGEMTCMSKYPRSATVRASTDCVVLEMLRNVLDILLRNKSFREELERKYRERALHIHLRSFPDFAEISDEFIDYLRGRVTLERYTAGQEIFRQGDPADAFYLVRVGFVKVSEIRPGGEFVLAYLPRGKYFGEIGLLGEGVRTASCTALDHVELVRIGSEDFALLLERFPDVRDKLKREAQARLEQNLARSGDLNTPLKEFLENGLMQAQSLLVLDLDKCVRCDACVRACAAAHDGVTRLVREGIRFENQLVATSCRSCRDPLCMIGCPVGSIRRRDSLEIIIEDWCIGCGLCATNCPYGNINMHPVGAVSEAIADTERQVAAVVKQKAAACDLCMEHAEPSCVYACPHDAAKRVDAQEWLGGIMSRRESGVSDA